jgi:drug/metabolite transporter (DMT)-like permease
LGSWSGGALPAAVGFVALVLFYGALAAGAMAVAAPISGVTAAVLPLGVGLLSEEPPGPVALAGAGCAVVAIALVSLAPHGVGARVVGPRLIGLSLAAGVGFGLFFVLLDNAADAADRPPGLWPIAASQVGALAVGAVLLLGARSAGGEPVRGGLLGWVAVAGVLDMAANALYLIASRDGLLSIVAPLAALYPVSTVLLALAIDRERIRPVQLAGLGLAVLALVLTAS